MDGDDSTTQLGFGMSRAGLAATLKSLADDLEKIGQCADAPSPAVAINSWALGWRSVPCLLGRPIGHPSVGDGRACLSSELFYLDPGRGIARTMSRWYRLGTRVDPDHWSDRHPDLIWPTRTP